MAAAGPKEQNRTGVDGAPAALLYGPDGRAIPPDQFRGPVDSAPGPIPWGPMAGGRPPEYHFPPLFNATITPRADEGSPRYGVLRELADSCDMFALARAIRVRQIGALSIDFTARGKARSRQAQASVRPSVERAKAWWATPNKSGRGYKFVQWAMQVMGEALTTDGVRLLHDYDAAGELQSLRQTEPDHLKAWVNKWGALVGWLYVRRGFPTYQIPAQHCESPEYTPTARSAYALALVEQIPLIMQTATSRQRLDLAHYTAGNIPAGWLNAAEDMPLAEITALQTWMNEMLQGDPTTRARLLVAPYGSKYQAAVEPKFDKQHAEMLAAQIMAVMGVDKSLLLHGDAALATVDVTSDLAAGIGIESTKGYLKAIIDSVTQSTDRGPFRGEIDDGRWVDIEVALGLGLPDIEVTISDSSPRRAKQKAELAKAYVDMGALTAREVREEEGFDSAPVAIPPASLTAQLLNSGVLTRDDVRHVLGAEPMAGELGDELLEGRTAEPFGGGVDAGQPKAAQPGAAEPAKGAPAGERSDERAEDPIVKEYGTLGRWAAKRRGRSLDGFSSAVIPSGELWRLKKALARSPAPGLMIRKAAAVTLTGRARKRLLAELMIAISDLLARQKAIVLRNAQQLLGEGVKKDATSDLLPPGLGIEGDFLVEITPLLGNVFAAGAGLAIASYADLPQFAGLSFDWVDPKAAQYGQQRGAELVTRIDETTREQLRELVGRAIEEGWSWKALADAIEEKGTFADWRAETIGRTELAIAQNAGQLETFGALGAEKVEVYDGDDFDEPCIEANGQIWTIEEAEANPTEHPNCERAFAPVFDLDEQAADEAA